MKPSQEHGDSPQNVRPDQGRDPAQLSEALSEFFIPDLCGSRSVFVMIVLAELLVIVHTLAVSSLPVFDWRLFALGSLTVLWIVLLSASVICQLRTVLSRLALPMATICCLLVVVIVTLVTSYLLQWLPQPLRGENMNSWQLLRNIAVAAVVASVVMRYFYLQHQLRIREQLELASRLNSLRDKIRPHFLFNTLNSIASLIASQPDAAERAVEDLSELFRMSLQDERRVTTVGDELRLCEMYLGIEKLRLGERLQVEWQVDDGAREQPMPGLVLQPLVENAIYHGVSTLPEGGTVRIAIGLTANELQASVENPVSKQMPASQGNNIALENIESRLDALYGLGGKLQVIPGQDRFRVELRYPREVLL
jgi:two-component system, LytTR family, sensor histidine kinase AlgZ